MTLSISSIFHSATECTTQTHTHFLTVVHFFSIKIMTNSEKKRLVTLTDEEKDTNFGVTVDHEFSCRALHWQDVAEFERKELSKVRVHHALRAVSTALAALAVVAASMGIIDVELYYLAQGKMIPPIKLRNYQINCSFTWANLTVDYTLRVFR